MHWHPERRATRKFTIRHSAFIIQLLLLLLSLVGNAQAHPLPALEGADQRGPVRVLAEAGLTPALDDASLRWAGTGAGVALSFFALVAGINQCRKLFGRTPPINEEIAALRGEFHHALGQCVTITIFKEHTDGMDRRCFSIERQIKEQVTATDKYLHDMRHEVKGELQSLSLAGEQRRELIEEKIATLSRESSERTGKVHQRVDKIGEQISGQGTVLHLIASHLKIRMGGQS